jgi:basic membrane lipoprotein Med (substrate-binding protein (PBP1-ABC) superfamily)
MRRAAAGPLAALALVVACAPGATREAGFRVALVAPGSIADAAWNAGAYAGLLLIRDSLGVTVSDVEARTPGEQEEALRTYAAQGFDLVFGHGFEFQQPAERVAAEHPGTVIIVTSGERAFGNVAPLVFRIEEGTFLAGMVAGGMSVSGKIGFVGGIELPPIRRGYEGWVAGARRVNPAIETRVAYLNTFDDAAAGREAALAMVRLGVDMLHHNADAAGLGVFQAAKESPGVFAFGANADQRQLAPQRVLGSAIIDLPRAFLAVAREVRTGRFTPAVQAFGLQGGIVRFVLNPELEPSLPSTLRVWLSAAEDSIVAGTLVPIPPGP